MALAERVLLLAKQFRQQISEQAGSVELAEAEWLVLWACVASRPPCASQNQLAERLAVSPAQVSGMVERLRQRDLLESRRDPCDRRRQVWRATAAGAAAIEAALREMGAWAGSLDTDPTSVSPEQLIEELDRLLARFQAAPFLPLPLAADGSAEPDGQRPARRPDAAATARRGAA